MKYYQVENKNFLQEEGKTKNFKRNRNVVLEKIYRKETYRRLQNEICY